MPPAARLTALPNGQLGAKSRASSCRGWDLVDTARSTGCYRCFPRAWPPAPSGIAVLTQRVHIQLRSRAEGPGGHCHTPCGSPPVQPPLRDLTQGSLSLHFLEVLAVLGFPSIFLYISVSTFFWSACFFTSLESSAWMVWGGRTGWRYQPCTTSACHPQQVPPPLGCARNVVEELRNSSRGDPASSCPMSQCHGAVPGWHGTPCESNAPLSFLAVQATPCLAQGAEPDIRKGILSFNRDRKVSALRTDMCQLSHFLSGSCWESSLKTQPGVKWDCSKTHSVPTPALLGQEKALSPVWSPQAPQKQQEEPGS